jgi:tetratricopeptide (TPR) repeat protein
MGPTKLEKGFNRRDRRVSAEAAEKCVSLHISSVIAARFLRPLWLKAFSVLLITAAATLTAAQSTHTTVRHHKVEDQDPAAVLLNEAESDIAKQDYATAEPLLKKYLETYPESYAAWYDLGYAYRGLGRKEEATAAFRKSIAAKPDVFESNLDLGLTLADLGQPDAEQFLRAAVKLKPTSGDAAHGQKRAWTALGHLLESSKPNEAAQAYQQAAALAPKDAEPLLLAGAVLEKDSPSEAEKAYQHALQIAPDNSDALTALTNLYMRQKRFPDAEASLRKLIVVMPKNAGVHLQLGRMLIISGKNEEAAQELETGIKLDPDPKGERDLANLYTDMGKYDEAQKLYGALLTLHPDEAGLHHGLGRVLLKQKRFPESQQELVKAVQLKPDLGEAYGDLAIAANENKDYATTLKALDTRAKYVPDTPITFFFRATAYDHLRDAKQAARYYHQFLDAASGKFPEQEWQAKHRLIAIEPKK